MVILATELEKMDYIGLAALITALTGMISALGVVLVKLKEISGQNVELKEQNVVIHDAVNSNMEAQMVRNDLLSETVTQMTSDKRDVEDLAAAKPIDVNVRSMPKDNEPLT